MKGNFFGFPRVLLKSSFQIFESERNVRLTHLFFDRFH